MRKLLFALALIAGTMTSCTEKNKQETIEETAKPVRYYYRIAQYDKDGKVYYSIVVR